MNELITIKVYMILLFILMGGNQLMGQSSRYVDSLLIETKYAKGKKKLQLTKYFSRKFHESLPKEVAALIDESLQQLDLSTLDSVEMHLLKGRAAYYVSDFSAYFKNIKILSLIHI